MIIPKLVAARDVRSNLQQSIYRYRKLRNRSPYSVCRWRDGWRVCGINHNGLVHRIWINSDWITEGPHSEKIHFTIDNLIMGVVMDRRWRSMVTPQPERPFCGRKPCFYDLMICNVTLINAEKANRGEFACFLWGNLFPHLLRQFRVSKVRR